MYGLLGIAKLIAAVVVVVVVAILVLVPFGGDYRDCRGRAQAGDGDGGGGIVDSLQWRNI